MLNKIDYAVEMLFRAKNDKKTLMLSVGCVLAFGVAVGAITVYERLIRELEQTHKDLGSPRRQSSVIYEEEEY